MPLTDTDINPDQHNNKGGKLALELQGGVSSFSSDSKMGNPDLMRHTLILDAYRGKRGYTTGGTTNIYIDIKNNYSEPNAALHPTGLFGSNQNAEGTSFNQKCKARLFSFRIYETENGVENLVHEYLPYKKGDIVGLRDTVTGNVLTNVVAGASAFSYGGMGVDGAERWSAVPAGGELSSQMGALTLSANAYGAYRYRWTKNGVPIDGGEDGDLSVEWMKGDLTDAYAVTAIYKIGCREIEGAPVSCTVTNKPRGMIIYLQ